MNYQEESKSQVSRDERQREYSLRVLFGCAITFLVIIGLLIIIQY